MSASAFSTCEYLASVFYTYIRTHNVYTHRASTVPTA